MRLTPGLLAVSMALVFPAAAAAQRAMASTTVTARATFAPRPTLTLSSHALEFRIEPGTMRAEAIVDFTAAMRAAPDAEIVLTMEVAGAVLRPGGAADVDAVLTFTGEGDGVQAGALEGTRSVVVARWPGGGQHRGRLVFTLRAPAPGHYTVPVRYMLGTP